jgi:TDG/mug DNA glycosylase family protein
MPFTRAELASFSDRTVEDLLGPRVRLLFVGINPGLWTAATGAHFAHPGNRFYPALLSAGILDRPMRVSEGMTDDDRRTLIERGVGITNLAARATARADELTAAELRAGAVRLVATVERVRPSVVAMVGITAYRAAFGRRTAKQGRQEEGIAGVPLWVLPNPSGLNAHDTTASLGRAYREPAIAAGIVRDAEAEADIVLEGTVEE